MRQSYRQPDTDPHTPTEEVGSVSETDDVGSLLDRLELEGALAGIATTVLAGIRGGVLAAVCAGAVATALVAAGAVLHLGATET